jgi:hypothetical protein
MRNGDVIALIDTNDRQAAELQQELGVAVAKCLDVFSRIVQHHSDRRQVPMRGAHAELIASPGGADKPTKGMGSKILVDAVEAARQPSIHVNTLAKIPAVDLPKVRIGPSKRGVRYRLVDIEAYAKKLYGVARESF